MKISDSQLDRDTLVRWVPDWRADQVESIKLLTRGALNYSWLVTVSGEKFVLKHRSTQGPAPGTELAREIAILERVSTVGLGPSVQYADTQRGLIITRYVEGTTLGEPALKNPKVVAQICKALQQLHALEAPESAADIGEIVEGYLEVLPGIKAHRGSGCETLVVELRGVFADWLAGRDRPCIGHNDLLHTNIVDGETMAFIDWEYASVSDPMFDLAVLAQHHGFGEQEVGHMLMEYFGTINGQLRHRIALSRIIAELMFSLWVLACRAQIDPEIFPEQGGSRVLVEKLAASAARYQQSLRR